MLTPLLLFLFFRCIYLFMFFFLQTTKLHSAQWECRRPCVLFFGWSLAFLAIGHHVVSHLPNANAAIFHNTLLLSYVCMYLYICM